MTAPAAIDDYIDLAQQLSPPPELAKYSPEVLATARLLIDNQKLSRSAARKLRKAVITAWTGHCAACGHFHGDVLQIHHVDPVTEFGGATMDSLLPLCPNCHAYVHALRRVRTNPERFQALKDQVERVLEGDDRAVDFLARIAQVTSTKERLMGRKVNP